MPMRLFARNLPFFLLLTLLLPTTMAAEEPTAEEPVAQEPASPEALYTREVEALHRFFQDWFNGELPNTDEAFARFADALDTDFFIVPPSGHLADRPRLLELLRPGHGRYEGDYRGRVWVENVKIRRLEENLAVVTYEEWQKTVNASGVTLDDPRGRLSSALLRLDPEAPGGVRWLHVHETWLPE